MTRGGRRTSKSLIADPSKLRRKFEKLFDNNDLSLDINGELLKRGVPIHFGGMSDPFSNATTTKISQEMLRFLSDYEIPFILSTKNTDVLIKDETLKTLERNRNVVIQISLSTASDSIAHLIEPNAPSPSARLRAVSVLSSLGKHIIIRLQPLIPSLIRENEKELIPLVASKGAKHVIVEFLKLPVEKNISRMNTFFNVTAWNGYEFYREKGSKLIGREWVLPLEYKWYALQPIIAAIRNSGMTYGAADYGLNHLGDTDCCCGIDNVKGFSNWFHGNISNIIKTAPPGYITIDQIRGYWYPQASIRRVMNSNSRKADQVNIEDYIVDKWNSPNTANALNEYLGVSWKGDYDGEQNCVYYKEIVT